MQMGKERRLKKRHSWEIPVKVARRPFTENPPFVQAVMSNINSYGLFVTTEQDFPIASRMFLEFYLAFEELSKLQVILSVESLRKFSGKSVRINVSGIVIRVQNDGAGIIFDNDYTVNPV
ncbi:MAG: hypothetical protein CSB24_02740 [Deltaproteobacteria bacterium]|nr:MAG: hypothetical protein CSB24_02740 [Deltaproteobacteria bacterium]